MNSCIKPLDCLFYKVIRRERHYEFFDVLLADAELVLYRVEVLPQPLEVRVQVLLTLHYAPLLHGVNNPGDLRSRRRGAEIRFV